MKPAFLSILSAAIVAGISPAGAVTVAFYDFEEGANAREASDDADAGSTAGNFTLSGGTATGGTSPQAAISTSTNQPFIRSLSLTNSKSSAIAENDFFSFSLTPGGGAPYSMTTLSFGFGGSNLAAGDTADDYTAFLSLQVQVGAGSYFDVGSEISRLVPQEDGNSGPQLSNFTIDLSTVPELQGVTAPVNFRFYLYSTVFADAKIVRMDNVRLEAIPEPSVALLGVAGVAGLAFRRRRGA